MQIIQLRNKAGQDITAHLFVPRISIHKFVLINSATGVKQQIYFKFAQYLADKGFTILTYDYTGIGLSKPKNLKNCKSSMRSWGTEDYKSITVYIKENFENFEKYVIGHSVGALILGMNADSMIFKSFVFIATQKAFAGRLNFSVKILGYLGFGILQPICTKIFGYFPAHRFGLGESLPAEVANDWRTLIINKNSTNALLEKADVHCSKDFHKKVLVLWAEDDHWLNENSVKSLLLETYPNLKPRYRILKISESPNKEIGHINFFRSYNKKLWKIIAEEFK